jgi:catechol 2,3-dioxygenase-like lactoylglutathione lyase family enzyme
MLDLAKPAVDVGLYTERWDEAKAFYGERLGLPFEEMLPIGNGVRQYRFGLNGSVLKVNHSINPLAHGEPTGYVGLVIVGDPTSTSDADGLPIEVVEPGGHGVTHLGIRIRVSDLEAADIFWADTMGAERVGRGAGVYRVGTTLLLVEEGPGVGRAGKQQAVGFRYITIQIKDVDTLHKRLIAAGVEEGMPVRNLGEVARISFVRDPDGNGIELSQRASLTGPLPD